MRIITTKSHDIFTQLATKPLVGFISGPVRIVAAIAQIAINGFAYALVSSKTKDTSEWSNRKTWQHLTEGGRHIRLGFIEFLPGSSFALKNNNKIPSPFIQNINSVMQINADIPGIITENEAINIALHIRGCICAGYKSVNGGHYNLYTPPGTKDKNERAFELIKSFCPPGVIIKSNGNGIDWGFKRSKGKSPVFSQRQPSNILLTTQEEAAAAKEAESLKFSMEGVIRKGGIGAFDNCCFPPEDRKKRLLFFQKIEQLVPGIMVGMEETFAWHLL